MKSIGTMILALLLVGLALLPAEAAKRQELEESFVPLVGNWHVDRDGPREVYAVDGRNWEQGLLSQGAQGKAKILFGAKADAFLKGLEAYRYFPLSVWKESTSFHNGEIEVAFKAVSGLIDQGAGIAFDLKPNGDYLVIRANPLEDNLVLFKMKEGRRATVQWIRNVPTPSGRWHTLKIMVSGNRIEGYLDGRKYINYLWSDRIGGKVGLWSKSDSYVFFDNFSIKTR